MSPATDPVVLMMTYSTGFGGPRSVTTITGTGAFSVAIRCPVGAAIRGVASASASEYSTGTVILTTTSAEVDTGTISFTCDSTSGTTSGETSSFPGISGSVSVTNGRPLPDYVELEYPAGVTGPSTASVVSQPPTPTQGAFTVNGIAAAAGSALPATPKARPADYQGLVTYTPTTATATPTL